MAFDYGSINLGIKNPFKTEGAVQSLRGTVVAALGIYLLFIAAQKVQTDQLGGWIIVLFGLGLLGSGIKVLSQGIIAMMRYYVGRSHPTSLAYNRSRSETTTAKEESSYTAYSYQRLIEMFVGRKNSTFIEPQGFIARLVHSFFPRLTYMPYPVRNLTQLVFGAWIKTILALVAYALVAFVSLAGFAGEAGKVILPVYSVVLTLFLLYSWRSAGTSINRMADKSIPVMGAKSLTWTIAGAIILPVVVSILFQMILNVSGLTVDDMNMVLEFLPSPHTMFYLLGTILGAIVTSALVAVMVRKRTQYADPKTEVSELRENWQESVHPNEVFINLDNLVMANRRYKEVPNRVYQELDPKLNEQVEGKGSFSGELMQEIQPQYKPMELGDVFNKVRLISLITGNALFVIGSILTMMLGLKIAAGAEGLSILRQSGVEALTVEEVGVLSAQVSTIVHLFFAGMFVRAFARILSNSAHLFFAELQFESNLIYFKVEGTFTESKISTGAGIYDSTRSENTLVRSSITPWVIVSRIVTSTFAATGIRNLEHPRFIMEMHKNDAELKSIREDVIGFLKDRESIASITSERDLSNASQIHQINQQSRAIPVQGEQQELLKNDAEAAGYIRQQEEQQTEEGEDTNA